MTTDAEEQYELADFGGGDSDMGRLEAQMEEFETLADEARKTNARTRDAFRSMDEIGEALADLEEAVGAEVPIDAEAWEDIPADQQVTIAKARLTTAIGRLTGEKERGYNGTSVKEYGFE